MLSTPVRSRIRLWIVPAAFVLVLAGPAVHDTPARAATLEQCQNGWGTAPASSSCDITVYGLSGGDTCGIAASCPADDGTTVFTSISLEVDQFPQLRNCDGALTISQSSC